MSKGKTQITRPKGSKHPGRQFHIYSLSDCALESWVYVKSNGRMNSVGKEGLVA